MYKHMFIVKQVLFLVYCLIFSKSVVFAVFHSSGVSSRVSRIKTLPRFTGGNWSRSSEERVYQSRAGGAATRCWWWWWGGVKPPLLYIQTPPLEARLKERSRENPLRAGNSTNPPTNNRFSAVTPISSPPAPPTRATSHPHPRGNTQSRTASRRRHEPV